MFTRTIHQKPTHKKYSSSNNFKKYNRIIHYFNLTENTKNKYSIRIYYNENMKGFGDGLNNIILNYSSNMFPKPSKFNNIGSIKQDLRPQKIIADLSNYNNILPIIVDNINGNMDECTEGMLLRRNINYQRYYSKYIFNYFSNIIEDELYISLLSEINKTTNSIINILPEDIMIMIIKNLKSLNLFQY